MNLSLQKFGGFASLVMAATFIFGMAVFFSLLEPAGYLAADTDPVAKAAFLAENQFIISLWYLIIYVLFGISLVVLAIALHERFKKLSPAIINIATAFGLIWAGLMFASGMVASVGISTTINMYAQDPAQAGSLWLTVNTVITGLGGGNEIVGGLWVLLISAVALNKPTLLPKGLMYSGLLVGIVGVLQTLITDIEALGAIFGIGLIVWFVWTGIYLLHQNSTRKA